MPGALPGRSTKLIRYK